MSANLRQGFLLGEFRVHPSTRTITGSGGTQHLSPHAMDLLVYFAQNPDRLLSREQLIEAVWNNAEAADASLTRCIADLRHHFDDHVDNPRYIETLPRRGYRLLASVRTLAEDHGRHDDPAAHSAPVTAKADYRNFFAELRRRRVIRVGLVYLVAAWLIIQVAQATFPALLLPGWSVTLVVILIVLGFPFALILSWAYQVKSEGADPTATTVHYIVDRSRKIDFAVITALAALVVILAYERFFDDDSQTPAATQATSTSKSDRPSIAVLPFLNLSDDPQNAYFSDGLTEEILNLLVRVQVIDVAARTSSFFFKGKDVDIKTVATRLGVRNVLEGSVRREGDKIRVTAQLIDAESGFHLWSNTYDRKMQDIFEIQDDIARQVVDALEIVLSAESDAILARVPTSSVDAYEYYLQGRDYLRGEHSDTRLQSARSLFERAIALDSTYAEAHAGLCDTFLAFYRRSRSTEFVELAERACQRGLELDSGAVDVYLALGNLYRYSGRYEQALLEYQNAIDRNSNEAEAYGGLAETYKELNRFDEAERNYRHVIEIQPGYWRGYLELGSFLYYAGRLDEAIEAYSEVIRLAPDNATGYLNLGSSYYLKGDFENAATAWTKSLELQPSPSAYMNVGSSYFFLARFDEAAAMYRTASELSPDDFEIWGSLGDALTHSKSDPAQAADAYKKAVELGEGLLSVNPSDAQTMATLSQYYAHLGNTGRAMELITEAEKLQPQNMYVHYFSAVTHASTGNKAVALAAISKAVELGYPNALLAMDAGLSNLAGEEKFKELIGNKEN
jgi:TolB-like protein/tetratricopeptide (TPR) repeat protein/DNA-binding winged helix-turn-helix (wHTH) protein